LQEIYNLACPMSPKRFMDNRLNTLMANSYAIKNLLDLAVKYSAKFLHFSSSVVYGGRLASDPHVKIKEDFIGSVDPLSARSSYDEGKRFSESMAINYRSMYNVDVKIMRLFRVYGPRMESDDHQMIPDFIINALDGSDITIHGGPEFSSSFCYVTDVIDAVEKFMKSDLSGPINVGSDVDIKLTDLVDFIIKETNSQSKIIHGERELFVSELVLPDIHYVKNELGWMPVVTLENGLKKTIFDLKAHKKLQGFGS